MLEIPIKNPKPDFNTLVNVLDGSKIPDRVIKAELLIDEEIKEQILVKYFNEKNYPPPIKQWSGMSIGSADGDGEEKKESYEKKSVHNCPKS